MLCASVWLMLSSMLYSLRLSSGSSFPKPLTLEEERYYLEKSAAGDRTQPASRGAHHEQGLKQSEGFRCEKMTRWGPPNFRKISSSTRSRVLPFFTTM